MDEKMPVPLVWREPKSLRGAGDLAIWLPAFSWKKERVLPHFEALAAAGFVAVSFDLRDHGERLPAGESMHTMADRVKSNRRRFFWPIIGQTAEDVTRVLDWAIRRFAIMMQPVTFKIYLTK